MESGRRMESGDATGAGFGAGGATNRCLDDVGPARAAVGCGFGAGGATNRCLDGAGGT